jgi:hypothetical protein
MTQSLNHLTNHENRVEVFLDPSYILMQPILVPVGCIADCVQRVALTTISTKFPQHMMEFPAVKTVFAGGVFLVICYKSVKAWENDKRSLR